MLGGEKKIANVDGGYADIHRRQSRPKLEWSEWYSGVLLYYNPKCKICAHEFMLISMTE